MNGLIFKLPALHVAHQRRIIDAEELPQMLLEVRDELLDVVLGVQTTARDVLGPAGHRDMGGLAPIRQALAARRRLPR